MNSVVRKIIRLFLIAIVLAAGAILLGVVPFYAGFVGGPVETAVRDSTGLEFHVGGPIKLRLGPWPSVATGNLVLGDAAHAPLLVVDSLYARIGLLALLRGRIRVLELKADGVTIDYCSPFPEFPETPAGDTVPPSIAVDGVEITRISVGCGPSSGGGPPHLVLEQVFASASQDAPLQVSGEGALSGMTFRLTFTGGELDHLLAGTERFPVEATLSSDAAVLQLSGHLRALPSEPSVDAQIEIRGMDVQTLAGAFDLGLPDLGLLSAQGRLHSDLETLGLVGFKGGLGNSRFAFDAALDMTGDRVHAGLSGTLDPLDLAPFLKDEAVARQSSPSSFGNDADFGTMLTKLDAFDADLQLAVRDVLGLPIDVNAVELRGHVADGIVVLQSLTANVLGGQVSVTGELRRQAECPELTLQARGSELDLATLSPVLPLGEPLGGRADVVNVESSSCGSSLLAHRKSLRADVEVVGVHARLGGEPFPLSAKRIALSVKPGERSRMRFVGELANEAVEATLAAGSLEMLLGPDSWPINVDARGGGGQLQVDGRARLVPGQTLVDVLVQLDVPKIGTLHAWTGGAADASSPLRATTRLRLDEFRFAAETLTLSLGRSALEGGVTWSHAQDPAILAVNLHSDYLDLGDIGSLMPVATADSELAATADDDGEAGRLVKGFELPPVDLDVTFDALHADRFDIQDFSLSGRLRKGLIDDARISAVIENEIELQGALNLDMRQLPARARAEFSAENLNIGRVLRRLEVADDIRLRADTLELLVTSDGSTPRQLLLNTLMQVDLHGFNWKIRKTGSDSAAVTGEALDVTLSLVQLTMAPNQPTIWSSKGRVDDLGVELWMQTPSLNKRFSDIAELPIKLVAAAGNDVVMIDTRVDRSAEDRLLANVLLSGEVIAEENRNLAELTSPLEDYQLQSDIVLSKSRLQLPDVQMRLGSSTAKGRFHIDASGPRTQFDVELHVPYLQTDDLLYWSKDFRAAKLENDAQLDEDGDHDVRDEDAPDDNPVDRGVFFLARNFIATFRESNDLGVNITVDELRAGTDLLGGGEIRLYVDENDFNLKPVTFSLPGGGVNAEYTASTRNGRLDAGLKIKADGLSYGGLLHLANHESEARGLLFLDTDIRANTEWSPGAVPFDLLLENADGSFDFAAWPENIEAGVLDLWTANLVLALLPRPQAGETSRLNCVVSRSDLEDGVMKSRTTLLDATDTIVRGRGTIDFAKGGLDLLVWPQAKREKFLSASTPVKVTGTFDDFQIGVEPAGFLGTLVKWYTNLIYVPFKWLTGERFPPDGTPTCFDAMDWELTPELHDYFLQRDFSAPPSLP